ncbi:hypothetical protein ACHAP5_008531 [Fusarium lateritium]
MKKRSRACEACQALKVKCEPSPDESICERCARSNITCVPAARKWQRDRIAELEEQVKNLQDKLDGASTQGLSTCAASTRATSVFSAEGSWSGTALPSILNFLDAHLDYESQLRCLEVCSRTTGKLWALVPLVDSSSARSWLDSIRAETPVKLMAMIACAMAPKDAEIDLQTQEDIRVKILEILGKAAVGLKPPSLDLVQAALIVGLWIRPSLESHGNPLQLVSLAQTLSVELGLGGESMPSSPPAWFFRIQGPSTLEMQKIWLVSWMTSTMAAIPLRREHSFDWQLSHYEALHALETDNSDSMFIEMLHTVRLHAQVANALDLCNMHSFHDINSDFAAATRSQIYSDLNALGSRPLAHDVQLRFWRMQVAILANEPVLHTATNKILFGSPYLSERIGVNDFACLVQVSETTAIALRSLVEACHLSIDIVLEMEPSAILGQPSLCFGPAVSYTLSILVKVFVAVSAPGNTYSQILTRDALRIRDAMKKLVAVKENLLKLDPHMGNWNTRIIGSVEWLGVWLDDYEGIIQRYETNLEREAAEQEIEVLSPNGHF